MPRVAAAFALLSLWLMLMLTGWVPAWLAFVVLAAAAGIFPWRRLRGDVD